MKVFLIVILFFSFVPIAFGQQILPDSDFTNKTKAKSRLINSGQDTIKKTMIDKQEGFRESTKYRTALRLGVGIQKSFFSELGMSRQKYYFTVEGFASMAYYTSLEWIPTFSANDKNIFGLKIGYEINLMALALGLEAKYQTDFTNNDFIITPKIGYGIGEVNLFYGYNISTIGNQFSNIGHNQFSIACTLNRPYFRMFRRNKWIL